MKNLKILIIVLSLLIVTPQTLAKKAAQTATPNPEYMNLTWWHGFGDTILDEYLVKVYENNPDLKIASLQTQQSRQVMNQAFANQLPQLYFSGNLQRIISASDEKFGSLVIPDYNQSHYYLPLTMSYEVDIWGENYLKTKSMKKQIEMTKQDERASYISISSDFVSNYFTLIGLDRIIVNHEKLLKTEEEIVNLTEKKYQSGLCPLAELLSEKQTLTQISERLNSLKERQDITINQLISQLGDRYLTQINRSNFEAINVINTPAEISTEYIENRPDIKKAEFYIEKTGIDVKVARRDFLPKFQIYGQAGFNAFDFSRIFAPHTFLSNIGIAPSIDLFTGGYKKAKLKYNKLEYEKALQIYEKSILTSIQELNDAMMSVKTSSNNYQRSEERFKLEQDKLLLADVKYKSGGSSKLEHLKHEQALLLSEDDVVVNKINRVISAINLYKATGGQDYNTAL